MRILGVDTSSAPSSVTLLAGGGARSLSGGAGRARDALPLIQQIFNDTGLTPNSLDLIAVATGPGSFTGIRVGMGAAQGLADALDKPLTGIGSLDAIAQAALLDGAEGVIIPLIPSTRGMVYAARFRAANGVLTRLAEDRELDAAELAAMTGEGVTLAGAGARQIAANFTVNVTRVMDPLGRPVSEGVARLAALGAGRDAIPSYISRSQAEINWERSQAANQ